MVLWLYIPRATVVFRSSTMASPVAQEPLSASSEPPPAPQATTTHLMFQPVWVPPTSPHTPLLLGTAFFLLRALPPYRLSA